MAEVYKIWSGDWLKRRKCGARNRTRLARNQHPTPNASENWAEQSEIYSIAFGVEDGILAANHGYYLSEA